MGPEMLTVDKQIVKLQELSSSETVEVSCYNNHVGLCTPGDVVEVVGIVKAELSGATEDSYTLKIECNNISKVN